LLVLLAISILGWKDDPVWAVIVGLLSALTVTIVIDMAIALVARVKASLVRVSRPPMQEQAVKRSKVGHRPLKGRLPGTELVRGK
jgi:hypothetical protein